MCPKILHIYGPLYINSYGLTIAIGLALFLWLARKHPRRKAIISEECFFNTIAIATLAGIAGGRLFYIFSEWNSINSIREIFAIWSGGYAVLGTITAILLNVPLYLKYSNVAIVPFLDFIALYAPLIQSIARVGCFLAGCCYGKSTLLPWGITYTNPEVVAPLHIRLHPTQLYSCIILLGIFLLLNFVLQKKLQKTGQLITTYLILNSVYRFVIDFLRADQTFTQVRLPANLQNILSIHQLTALGIFISASIAFVAISWFTNKYSQQYELV